MLVLTRQRGEQIRISDDIVITVVSVDDNVVRIGIEAPKELLVDREEVRERRAQETINTVNN